MTFCMIDDEVLFLHLHGILAFLRRLASSVLFPPPFLKCGCEGLFYYFRFLVNNLLDGVWETIHSSLVSDSH